MKLPVETWIQERAYGVNVRKLFHESSICYRNSAYRASLIFSYIGFLTIVKETIIKAQIPTSFTSGEWNIIVNKINDDEIWEKEVFEILINTKKPIFKISDDLKNQIKYWKDRRNDCAHFKYNEIEAQHTESFWSFVKSNIPKITVEGGMESLLNRFEEHFDETKTPLGSDFTHLVKEITNSVLPSEREDFFKEVKKRIDGRAWWLGNSNTFSIYAKILESSDEATIEALINYLKKEELDNNFLHFHPNKVIQFGYKDTEIRKMWKERLYETGMNPLVIYSSLLRNGLIPNAQIQEANEEIFSRFNQSQTRNFYFYPEASDIDTLKANYFFDTIKRIAIQEKELNDYMWVNSKADLIMASIEYLSLDKEVVNCICEMASKSKHSQWLVRELNGAFNRIPDLKIKFQSIASKNGISIPSIIK